MANCQCDCSNIDLSQFSQLVIQYSPDSGTTWGTSTSSANAIRFSTDNGSTWGNTLILPTSTSSGGNIVFYTAAGITGFSSLAGGAQLLGSEYYMKNSVTPVTSTTGDCLEIEAHFTLLVANTEYTVGIVGDNNTAPSANTLSTLTITPVNVNTVVIARAKLIRVATTGPQWYSYSNEIVGLPNSTISSSTMLPVIIDFESDYYISASCNAGLNEVRLDYMSIKLFKV